jgi:biotin synthase
MRECNCPQQEADPRASPSDSPSTWHLLANRVLAGYSLSRDEGINILQSSDDELLDLLAAAYRSRRKWFGHRVNLNFLINAKSGNCSENCSYCSQSRVSSAAIPTHKMLPYEDILAGAKAAFARGAKTYCIATSGRTLAKAELEIIRHVVPDIKRQYPLAICMSPGLLDLEYAVQLKACGVDRVNHNLNTSERYYPTICSTHSYNDRLATLRAAREAGLSLCSGGIVGMGEEPADVVDLALKLRELQVEAIPVNFLQPIAGTPLQGTCHLTPQYCLKVLVMFRLANPQCELRIAAGREMHLRSLQPLGLYVANSIFVGDYLTTKGQSCEKDYRMIEDLGFDSKTCA